MELLTSLAASFYGSGPIVTIAKFMLITVWAFILADLFMVRDQPKANHAFVAALAVILAELPFVVDLSISIWVTAFFLILAKIVLVVTYTRVAHPEKMLRSKQLLTILAAKNIDNLHHETVNHKFTRAVTAFLVTAILYSQVLFLFGR